MVRRSALPRVKLPAADDVLLVLGAAGAGVSVGGLFGELWGLLLVSVLALGGGAMLAHSKATAGVE